MGLTNKYFGKQDEERHGGILTWPGGPDGFPLLGDFHGHLKQDEFDALSLSATYKARVFKTWDAADMEEFVKVQDFIANGQFFEKRRTDAYDPDEKGWRILLEWIQVYGLPPRNGEGDAIHSLIGNGVPP